MKKNNTKKVMFLLLTGIVFATTARAVEAPPTSVPSLCKGSGVICKLSGPGTGIPPSTWDSEKDKDGSAIVIDL